jgi:hypothetical protein
MDITVLPSTETVFRLVGQIFEIVTVKDFHSARRFQLNSQRSDDLSNRLINGKLPLEKITTAGR